MLAPVMEFVVWLWDYIFQKRKSYVGHHWADTVSKVEPTYHPMPEMIAYPNLWEARLFKTEKDNGNCDCSVAAYLRVPLKVFYALVKVSAEIDRIVWLSDYRWKDTPLEEWPESWRKNAKGVTA